MRTSMFEFAADESSFSVSIPRELQVESSSQIRFQIMRFNSTILLVVLIKYI